MDRDASKFVCVGGGEWGGECEKYFPSTNNNFVRNVLIINY